MHYTKPRIIFTTRAALAIKNSKEGIGSDSLHEMTVTAYESDE
jgi:hypothetical protein